MALPTSREEFKDRCLRSLGAPVLEINVADEQVEDAIDTALQFFWDYHFDGIEKTYFKKQIDQQMIDDGYFDLPENITGVVRLFSLGDALNTKNFFSIRYQIALNDLYNLTNTSIVPFYQAFQHLRVLEEILVGEQQLRFNRHRNRVHIDMDWNKVKIDDFLVLEAYKVVDPDEYVNAWKDRWLFLYASAWIKRYWGSNLKKYENIALPGGVYMNGQQIYDEAIQELERLEKEMMVDYSLPVMDMWG